MKVVRKDGRNKHKNTVETPGISRRPLRTQLEKRQVTFRKSQLLSQVQVTEVRCRNMNL
jgi:hypothetical protein